MRTRIKDIAERVGVSTAQVSMYLNHHPLSARMAEKTKRRIDEAVREMNYQPSAAARSLKKGKSRTLGLVIGDIASVYSGFYSQMLLQEADKRGYQLLISLTLYDKKKEQECLRNLINRQLDGILYSLELDSDADAPIPEYLQSYPILLTQYHKSYNLVLEDFRPGFCSAFEVLEEKGIRHALLICEGGRMPVEDAVECAKPYGIIMEAVSYESMEQVLSVAQDRKACIFFFTSISARKFLIYCGEKGVKNVPPLFFNYSLPFDYFESPDVLGTIVEPFKDVIPLQIERLIEMVEKPEPEPRTCFLPVRFMRPAELRKYYEDQNADPYYRIIVEERKNLILRKDFTR